MGEEEGVTVTINEDILVVAVATLHLGMRVDSRNQIMGSAREQWW